MARHYKISTSIQKDQGMVVEDWVKRGAFESKADLCRTAIRRLLEDMENYKEKKVDEKKRKIQEDARELRDLVDGLY